MTSPNRTRIINACLIAFLLVAYGFAAPVAVRAAGTIVVTTTLDVYGGSACSLRNAVHAANINAPFGGCPAGNVIQLPAGNFQLTIKNPGGAATDESAGDLNITNSMTITGTSRTGTLVYAAGQSFGDRIFQVSSGNVIIQNMKISGGYVTSGFGGAIYNSNPGGNLALSGVILDGNASSYGGAVANFGSLSIDTSTISNNTAIYGGGIANFKSITISHSAIYSNHFMSSGGGLNNYYISGTPTATIVNTTIAFNDYVYSPSYPAPSGGGIVSAGDLDIKYSTIADNAWSGLYLSGGTLQIQDTILARNLNKPNCVINTSAATPVVTSNGYNLVDTVGQASAPEAVCNFGPTDILNQDAMLTTALASNAGATRTYGFVKGSGTKLFSPAIDAIPVTDTTCPPDDQRGFARPVDGNGDSVAQCDIGAYEERQLYYVNLPIIRR